MRCHDHDHDDDDIKNKQLHSWKVEGNEMKWKCLSQLKSKLGMVMMMMGSILGSLIRKWVLCKNYNPVYGVQRGTIATAEAIYPLLFIQLCKKFGVGVEQLEKGRESVGNSAVPPPSPPPPLPSTRPLSLSFFLFGVPSSPTDKNESVQQSRFPLLAPSFNPVGKVPRPQPQPQLTGY